MGTHVLALELVEGGSRFAVGNTIDTLCGAKFWPLRRIQGTTLYSFRPVFLRVSTVAKVRNDQVSSLF